MKLMPLLPYALIAVGLFSSLALFLTLKREIRRLVFRQTTRIEDMMATRLEEAARPPEPVALVAGEPVTFVPAPLHAGLNLNKRVHAMRMLRRGEDIGHVAAALGVPRREVELLIRVQSIGKARAANAGGE
jgi:hypothetical protein